MKLFIISSPDNIEKETEAIHQLFENGLECLHLRKPNFTKSDYAAFLCKISRDFHAFIVIHDFFDLCNEFNLKGIHHNSRNQSVPDFFKGTKSRSCHSMEEILCYKNKYDYLFLSPIFDSFSKHGYNAAFSSKQLNKASEDKIIDKKVMALGGVNPHCINQLNRWHFGGVAVLGYLWENFSITQNKQQLYIDFQLLQETIKTTYNVL